jgi:hypothetical protein
MILKGGYFGSTILKLDCNALGIREAADTAAAQIILSVIFHIGFRIRSHIICAFLGRVAYYLVIMISRSRRQGKRSTVDGERAFSVQNFT